MKWWKYPLWPFGMLLLLVLLTVSRLFPRHPSLYLEIIGINGEVMFFREI